MSKNVKMTAREVGKERGLLQRKGDKGDTFIPTARSTYTKINLCLAVSTCFLALVVGGSFFSKHTIILQNQLRLLLPVSAQNQFLHLQSVVKRNLPEWLRDIMVTPVPVAASQWQAIWEQSSEPFWHLPAPNPILAFIPKKNIFGNVFVPLCGASHDMRWFAEMSGVQSVIGVDIADRAIRLFFEQAQLRYEIVWVDLVTSEIFPEATANESNILLDHEELTSPERHLAKLYRAVGIIASNKNNSTTTILQESSSLETLPSTARALVNDLGTMKAEPNPDRYFVRSQEGATTLKTIEIFHHDLFDPHLKKYLKSRFKSFDLIFDRASIIAINLQDREKYADVMTSLLEKTDGNYYVQGMEYQEGVRTTPPRLVRAKEINTLYGERCDITLIPEARQDWGFLFSGKLPMGVECFQDLWHLQCKDVPKTLKAGKSLEPDTSLAR